ncbi:MAG: NAD-dependent epimerase/dehydratase family protein [Acidimicrobiia bacterium]|nr:NAD-dependent epimerase/dehydratase family protein [Acidimicrobiia bacterium]
MVGAVLSVSVIGSETSVGRAVVRRLEASGTDVTSATDRADALVHVDVGGKVDVDRLRTSLRAAGSDVGRVVYLSTAMVYGAWPNNPVPLTEDAPMRPNPGFAFATAKAESERIAVEWREANADARLAVLRPVTVLGGDDDGRLVHLLRDVLPAGVADPIPPVQYLHGDDLADALVLAATAGLDGVFNVAPDGWMSEEEARDLSAGPVRMRLPRGLQPVLGPDVPKDVLPYLVHPWVVANDRLRAEGWTPRYSSEEAFVAGAGVPRWQSLSLGRRQAIAVGGVAAAVAGGVAAGVAAYRRLRD